MGKRPRYLADDDKLLEGLRFGRVGVWRWKANTDDLEWTANLADIHELPPDAYDGTLTSFTRDVHPDDASAVWDTIKTAIKEGAPYEAIYRTAPRGEGRPLWIRATGGVATAADGARYLTGICLNVTERVEQQQELTQRLKQQQAVSDFGSHAITAPPLQSILDRAVQLVAEVLDAPLAKILRFDDSGEHLNLVSGVGWKPGLVGQATVGIERASQAGYTLLTGGPVFVTDLRTETRFNGPPLLLEHDVVSGISLVIPGSQARPFGVFGVHSTRLRNFTQADLDFLLAIANIVAGAARHQQELERRDMLTRELAHRSGNLLQVVSSIASQTFRESVDAGAATRLFHERVAALARSNYLIARSGWASTRFADLVDESLKPFMDRIETSGRDTLLPPDLSFDLGMILHELATNSAKYGRLAASDGESIKISWAIARNGNGEEHFWCEWLDPVTKMATGAKGGGFGSKLFDGLIKRKWQGTIDTSESPRYRFRLSIPLNQSADLPLLPVVPEAATT